MPSKKAAKPTTATYHNQGQLLGETEYGVDYVESSVYASAIAESIHKAKTSITVGIYAKWGSGKSFLLKHVENLLHRLQNQDELEKGQIPSKGYGCHKSGLLLCWTLALLLTILIFAVTVTMVVYPEIFLPPFNARNDSVTTTASAPTEEDHRIELLRILTIVGYVLFPVELLILLGLAWKGVGPSMKTLRGKLLIVVYALFTKMPIQKSDMNNVADPGVSTPEILRNVQPGDEVLTIASTPDVHFPRRYIFVSFKAWEYAGSDTLWAAIATNISDQIEVEFGVVTSRLFRALSVEEVPQKYLSGSDRTLYVRLNSRKTPRLQIKNAMKRYGVVESIRRLDDFPEWHEITFATSAEFRNAKDTLAMEGVSTMTTPPTASKCRASDESAPLVHDHTAASDDEEGESVIEMRSLPGRESVSRIFCCCRRFCTHFVRHPVTFCKLPRLYWLIILVLASILIPITAYGIARVTSIRTATSWRAPPPFVQLLIWLPGSFSVALFVSNVAWSLFNSQTKRIRRALDGTRKNMASQLGFMSVVKREVEVMTKLIRCARFVLRKDYRVIISVDDLDQVKMEEVHAVLEAISILLSEKSSPFFCMLAADPQIVGNCVAAKLGKVLNSSPVSGREYLRKIINLPVCLPELNEPMKKRFIAGLMDQSDATVTYARQHARNGCSAGATSDAEKDIGRKSFLLACRNYFYENENLRRHIHGNARDMKRIFNVISLTSCLINCIVKKQNQLKFVRSNAKGMDPLRKSPAVEGFPKIVRTERIAKILVQWIVLAEEWPFRTSFIVHVVQREVAGLDDTSIPDEHTIWEIYRDRVADLLRESTEPGDNDLFPTLKLLDGDKEHFQTFLQMLGDGGFKKPDILYLLGLSINLDHGIRRKIALDITSSSISLSQDSTASSISPPEDSIADGTGDNAVTPAEERDEDQDVITVGENEPLVDHAEA